MKRIFALAAAAVLLAGCSGNWAVNYEETAPAEVNRDWDIASVSIIIPEDLTLIEAPGFLAPNADIIWHGDPQGDRRAQVTDILRTGIGRAAAKVDGRIPVMLAIQLEQFHAVTPAAVSRAPSAVHNIAFYAQFFDANGTPISKPEYIQADLEANVGVQAIIAAQEGQTQRVRITDQLDRVMSGWLGVGPDARRTFGSLGR